MPRWLYNGMKERLALLKCPVPLRPGPEPLDQRAHTQPHVVLQSDERTGDTFGPAKGLGKPEARNVMLTSTGMELLIFARSRSRSPSALDHDEQARAIRDALVIALHQTFQRRNAPRWRLQPGRLLSRDEIDERRLTQWPGRIYRLGFAWDEPIKEQDFKGAGADTIDGGDVDYETTYETTGEGGNELPSATTEAP